MAECFNRVLGESIITMLSESHLPFQFWGEALAAFIHVYNRYPTSALPGTTLFEVWEGHKPDLSHLRVWGYTAYVHVDPLFKLRRAISHYIHHTADILSAIPTLALCWINLWKL